MYINRTIDIRRKVAESAEALCNGTNSHIMINFKFRGGLFTVLVCC